MKKILMYTVIITQSICCSFQYHNPMQFYKSRKKFLQSVPNEFRNNKYIDMYSWLLPFKNCKKWSVHHKRIRRIIKKAENCRQGQRNPQYIQKVIRETTLFFGCARALNINLHKKHPHTQKSLPELLKQINEHSENYYSKKYTVAWNDIQKSCC